MLDFLGGLFLDILSYIYGGFVLSLLWGWFLVPLGVPAIGIGIAIGLIFIGYMLTSNSSSTILLLLNKDKWGITETVALKVTSFIMITLVWVLGWATQLVFL